MPDALAYGFKELDLHRIEAVVEAGNDASGRVLRRYGFTHEGTLREAERKDGRWIDLEMWAKLRTPEMTTHRSLHEAGPRDKA
jgi:ribosomal-protein-alanine N-acetyltransferase